MINMIHIWIYMGTISAFLVGVLLYCMGCMSIGSIMIFVAGAAAAVQMIREEIVSEKSERTRMYEIKIWVERDGNLLAFRWIIERETHKEMSMEEVRAIICISEEEFARFCEFIRIEVQKPENWRMVLLSDMLKEWKEKNKDSRMP